jgi:hypothetical protein
MRCLFSIYKLSTLSEPGWDLSFVRSTLDLLQLLDRILARTSIQLSNTTSKLSDPDQDTGSHIVKIIRWIRIWCAAKLEPETAQSGYEGSDTIGNQDPMLSLDLNDILLGNIFDWSADMP